MDAPRHVDWIKQSFCHQNTPKTSSCNALQVELVTRYKSKWDFTDTAVLLARDPLGVFSHKNPIILPSKGPEHKNLSLMSNRAVFRILRANRVQNPVLRRGNTRCHGRNRLVCARIHFWGHPASPVHIIFTWQKNQDGTATLCYWNLQFVILQVQLVTRYKFNL